MNNRHKWYKEIQAWSEGAEIEYSVGQGWLNASNPTWEEYSMVYRIKPQPKEKKYLYVYNDNGKYVLGREPHPAMHYMPIIGKIEVKDD